MKTTVKPTQNKRKPNQFLPIMGLLIALCVGVIAYFGAPLLVDVVKDQVDLETRRRMVEDEQYLTIAFGVIIWLVSFSLLMVVVSAAFVEDPDNEERLLRPPPGSSPKELKRYYKLLEKQEKKRIKQAEHLKRRQDKE